jgi:hypothetical protein
VAFAEENEGLWIESVNVDIYTIRIQKHLESEKKKIHNRPLEGCTDELLNPDSLRSCMEMNQVKKRQ